MLNRFTLRQIFLIFTLALISGCVGPLHMQEPARTVGKHNHVMQAGYGSVGYNFKYTFGLTEDLDLSAQSEVFALAGVRTKYAFINNQDVGFSMASALGYGISWGGKHYYADFLMSYRTEKDFEPYLSYRHTIVKIDEQDFRDEEGDATDTSNDSIVLVTEESQYDYGLISLGSRFHINKRWSVTAEVSTVIDKKNEGLDFDDLTLVSVAGGLQF
jgi:hypothetical protein